MPDLAPDQAWNVEHVYELNGAEITGTGVTFREWSTGAARYWTGTAWTPTPTVLPLTAGRYLLTVPTAWLGLVVEAIVAFTDYPDVVDELVVVPVRQTVRGEVT
jgi:hypothetical protein